MKNVQITLLSLLILVLGLTDLHGAKKKLSMSEADGEGNGNICAQAIAFCLQLDEKDTIEVTLTFLSPGTFTPSFRIVHQDLQQLVWQSVPANISLQSQPDPVTYVFDVVVNLQGITTPEGRAGFFADITSIGGLQTPGGSGNSNSSNKKNFFGRAICLRDFCSRFDPCPCSKDPGGLKLGFVAGQQNPSFEPGDLTADAFAFNATNKFVGLQLASSRRRIYYQAELLFSQLNFIHQPDSQPNSTQSPVSQPENYALFQAQLVPVQLRIRLGKLGSIGSGLGFSYLIRGTVDATDLPAPSSPLDKLEPEWFADIRLGNSRKGLQAGYRYSWHWSGIEDLTGPQYRIGKLYLVYSF